ncbi:sensor histidine kinase [Coraliomargarita parva]|uniref:sensor histidine kinase n=1 Tax=Coraliomargarita parva TaxID=3014050 RepID=UPI0022B569EC|nr:hybrid sensor histidine kinase/response regulator [Coraliomargarita parva]
MTILSAACISLVCFSATLSGSNTKVIPLSEYVVKSLTTEEGLPMDQLNFIATSKEGYLWIASFEGLIRYDGHDFDLISHRDYATLRGGVFDLKIDKSNIVWGFDTNARYLFRYNEGSLKTWETAEFSNVVDFTLFLNWEGHVLLLGDSRFYQIVDDQLVEYPVAGIEGLRIYDAVFAPNGNLWIADYDGGVFRIKDGIRTEFDMSVYGSALDRAQRLEGDGEGGLWVITASNDLLHYDGKEWNLIQVPELKNAGRCRDLLSETNGSLWIGMESGMYRYNAGGIEKLKPLDDPIDDNVLSITQTPEGSIAYTTFNKGLKILQKGLFKTYTGKNGLRGGIVRCILKCPKGNYFIGSNKGVSRIFKGQVFHEYHELDGIDVTDIVALENGEVYFATYGKGLYRWKDDKMQNYLQEDGLLSDTIYRIAQGPDGKLWLATYSGACTFDGESFETPETNQTLPDHLAISLFRDSRDRMWYSIASGGLAYVKDGTLHSITKDTKLENVTVFHLSEDSDGILWAGYSGGILRVEKDRMTAYDLTGFFPRTNIFHVWNDGRGSLWLSTNSGLYRLDAKPFDGNPLQGSVDYKSYLKSDGLPSNNATALSHALTLEDEFWIPFNQGVCIVAPDEFEPDSYDPHVLIENITVNDQTLLDFPNKNISGLLLPPGLRQLNVNYSAPLFQASKRIQFKRRLLGFDNDWKETQRRDATYTNLPPGNYTFEVAVVTDNQKDEYTHVASIQFKVQPYFYETVWFYAICCIVAAILIYAFIYLRLHNSRVQQHKLSALVRARTRELEERSEELLVARDQAQSANRMKSEFIANISHEIRTPMNSIIGFATILNDELVDHSHRRYVNSVLNSGKTLLTLINDLLDISKIEANKLELYPHPTQLVELCSSVLEMFEPQVARRDIELKFTSSDDTPEYVMIDDARLRQVLVNLIGNAVKFTDKGMIELEIECMKWHESRVHLRITISDTGEGIEQGKLDSIFDSFEQIKGNKYRKGQGGSGLGLSISKRLTELMGGSILVESTPGQGSRFILDFNSLEFVQDRQESNSKRVPRTSPSPFPPVNLDDTLHALKKSLYECMNTDNCSYTDKKVFFHICERTLMPGLKILDLERMERAGSEIQGLNLSLRHSCLDQLIEEIHACGEELRVERSRALREMLIQLIQEYDAG